MKHAIVLSNKVNPGRSHFRNSLVMKTFQRETLSSKIRFFVTTTSLTHVRSNRKQNPDSRALLDCPLSLFMLKVVLSRFYFRSSSSINIFHPKVFGWLVLVQLLMAPLLLMLHKTSILGVKSLC